MSLLEVVHTTSYHYARPVRFGEHKAMLRPRDSHDLDIIDSSLRVAPAAEVRWMHDVFGNSITLLRFAEAAAELSIRSRLTLRHFALSQPTYSMPAAAERWPFAYDRDELVDLGQTVARHYPDPDGKVAAWARRFVPDHGTRTLDLLTAVTQAIKADFAYEVRDQEGTQPPLETLEHRAGSCRDFALLMMEAVRSLGFAARFVTGYLYDPALDGSGEAMQGAGATHAWAQVYVPGAGWLEFDPTNGIAGGHNLIRVGVARDPAQAVPIAGSWIGAPADYRGMEVDVQVRRVESQPS